MVDAKDAVNLASDDGGGHRADAFRAVRGALDNLVLEIRAALGPRNNLGLKVNVALNVAERALRTHPAPPDR